MSALLTTTLLFKNVPLSYFLYGETLSFTGNGTVQSSM